MEIDITGFVENEDPFEFSASRAERGEHAGRETWNNAKEQAVVTPLLSDDQLDAFRGYVRGFGAWEQEEIDAWSPDECNALFIQLVSGAMREAGMDDCFIDEFDWDAYQRQVETGRIGGNIYRGDDGHIYYYLGT